MSKQFNDEKFNYDLGLFNKKTLVFLKYAWKESDNQRNKWGG